jgi:hypothetical protein
LLRRIRRITTRVAIDAFLNVEQAIVGIRRVRQFEPAIAARTQDVDRECQTVGRIAGGSLVVAFPPANRHVPAEEFGTREAIFGPIETVKGKNRPRFPLLDGVGRSQLHKLHVRVAKCRAQWVAATELADGVRLRETGRRNQEKCEAKKSTHSWDMNSHGVSFPGLPDGSMIASLPSTDLE